MTCGRRGDRKDKQGASADRARVATSLTERNTMAAEEARAQPGVSGLGVLPGPTGCWRTCAT